MGKRCFERAVQSFDPVRDVDVLKVPAPERLESLGGNPPRVDESAHLDVRITRHMGYTV